MPMPIHPGETLSEMLGERRISQVRLAREIGVPPGLIGEIVRGHRAITADTALRLARVLGTTAQFWLRLQEAHDLERAHEAAGEDIDVVEPLGKRPAVTRQAMMQALEDDMEAREGVYRRLAAYLTPEGGVMAPDALRMLARQLRRDPNPDAIEDAACALAIERERRAETRETQLPCLRIVPSG